MKSIIIDDCEFELEDGDFVVRCRYCNDTIQLGEEDRHMDTVCPSCDLTILVDDCEVLS